MAGVYFPSFRNHEVIHMPKHTQNRQARQNPKRRTGLKLRTGVKAGARDTARYGDRYI